jgi:hypothetical protein
MPMGVVKCHGVRTSAASWRRGSQPRMRSVKSVISGFGVAISLVGAAACAFFITAALVAFNGTLQISSGYAPQATILTASAKHDPPLVIKPAAPRPVVRRVSLPVRATADRPVSTEIVRAPENHQAAKFALTAPTPTPVGPAVGGARTPASTSATAPLAHATAGLTTAVGGVVAGATESLGSALAPVSPALGGAVQGLGIGIANGVVALGNTVAGVVNALGTHPATPAG